MFGYFCPFSRAFVGDYCLFLLKRLHKFKMCIWLDHVEVMSRNPCRHQSYISLRNLNWWPLRLYESDFFPPGLVFVLFCCSDLLRQHPLNRSLAAQALESDESRVLNSDLLMKSVSYKFF